MSTVRIDFVGEPDGPLMDHFGVGTISEDGLHVQILEEFDSATYNRFSHALLNAVAASDRFTSALVSKNFQSYLSTRRLRPFSLDLAFVARIA